MPCFHVPCPSHRGCSGGSADDAFEYAYYANLTTESFYPYTSGYAAATGLCSPIIKYPSIYQVGASDHIAGRNTLRGRVGGEAAHAGQPVC